VHFKSQISNLKSPAGGDRFIDKRSRTHDQMGQAARSGKQNIAEDCFVKEGGFTERLYRVRSEARNWSRNK
jgi:hypothetical protein